MNSSVIFRFIALGALWLLVVIFLIVHTPKITLYTIFVIVASAIIVFLPMYKKYIKNQK